MKRVALFVLVGLVFLSVIAKETRAAIEIEVYASRAPNAFGSPSFSTYQSNAIYALQNGLSSSGNPLLPSYYQQLADGATIDEHLNTVTGFNSWDGVAGPSGAFASELGNRLTFSLHILGNGEEFSISQLSFVGDSSPNDILDFSFSGGYSYSAGYQGLNYGTDNIKGTGDDVYITSGASSLLVDELFGRGSGNAIAVYDSDFGATRQDKIENVLDSVDDPYLFSGTYTIGDVSGSAQVIITSVKPVPEPAAYAIWTMLGMVCVVSTWRKKRTSS
jgi:hypothetical protein